MRNNTYKKWEGSINKKDVTNISLGANVKFQSNIGQVQTKKGLKCNNLGTATIPLH